MPTEALLYGIPNAIPDNAVRALPAGGGRMFISGAATSIDLANDLAMTGAKNVLAAAGPFLAPGEFVSAGFIRVNGGTATIRITRP
jgi:hypothetical protein